MYAVCRELHSPTGVEHCLECHFFDTKQTSLVVASTSVLKVYNLSEPVGGDGDSKRKLVQAGEFKLYGCVQSMSSVRLCQSERDSLLLAFSPAKLSVVEYDPENNDLKTISLHYFEDDEEIKRGLLNNFQRPVIRVDPEGRCAVMLIFGTHLAVLPFRQDGLLDEANTTPAFLEDMQPTTPIVHTEEHHAILPTYMVELLTLTEKVRNVKDVQFLHGYNSPTLFILYEPIPTWAGRISLRKDTHCMVAISVNTSEKQSPVIWHNAQLPFDACYCIPVPKPLGGILLVGANTLIYMNQSSPSLGFSLNSMTDKTTHFQLRQPPNNLAIAMDCSQATFVSGEQLLVALRGGEIYMLTLVSEGRGVKNILFEKAAASVLPTAICCFGTRQVFVGSRLGNSLLLGYTKKVFTEADDKPPAIKRRKSTEASALGEEFDELEVYGAGHSSATTLASFKFEVFDSLLNIGPISNLTISQPAFLSEEFMQHTDPDLELVTCSGHGKNGALCVLQRELRPQVVTTFELPGCSDMWTVISKTEESASDFHTYLILSQADSTMVLQTGQEITELDSSGFATQAPTIFAGNMAGGHYIVQVTSTDVRLLKDTNQLCRVALDMGGGVRSCDLTDLYVIVLLTDGTVAQLCLREEQATPTLSLTWPELVKGSKISLISTYTDTSGLFVTEQQQSTAVADFSLSERHLSVEDEDELLYTDVETLTAKMASKEAKKQTVPQQVRVAGQSHTHWCAVYREDGSLEIYQVPDFKMVFSVRNFSSSPRTLQDSGTLASDHQRSSEAAVSEILLTGLGPSHSMPHLLAMVDGDLVVYTAFPYHQKTASGHLHLRFSKFRHEVLISDRKKVKTVKQLSQQTMASEVEEVKGTKFIAQLRKFANIGGYSGVFVCGPYPHWLMVTRRGALNLHPMFIDGPIATFTAFHNVNCPRGFLYFSAEGELRISLLPSHLSYDAPWPTRKVPLHATPHFLSYHMATKTHVLVTSEQEPCKQIPTRDSFKEDLETVQRDERFIWAMEDKYFLQLYAPTTWQLIPNTRYPLEQFERVVSMKVMKLRSQETMTGRKEYVVMGTTYVCGEAVQCLGKIRIFDVIEVNPEPGKPLTKNKLKCLYNEEQKGSISALEAVDGLLLACMGQKIYMWRFQDNKTLVGVAFIDTETYIHKALALKNFVLIADISRSVQVLRYQEHLRSLSLVSRDVFPGEVYACDFVVDGQQLGFVASDSDQNLILYQYQPELPESYGGLYLTRRGDFNTGSHINAFFRVHCKSAAPLGASADVKALMAEKRQVTFFATLDGGIGYLLPVPEKVYRRLLMLQTKLSNGLPHNAGLNPKAFRMFRSRHQYLYTPQRNILDGDLLMMYPQLSLKQRTDFAKQIGTSPAQILDDLKEMDKIATYF